MPDDEMDESDSEGDEEEGGMIRMGGSHPRATAGTGVWLME